MQTVLRIAILLLTACSRAEVLVTESDSPIAEQLQVRATITATYLEELTVEVLPEAHDTLSLTGFTATVFDDANLDGVHQTEEEKYQRTSSSSVSSHSIFMQLLERELDHATLLLDVETSAGPVRYGPVTLEDLVDG